MLWINFVFFRQRDGMGGENVMSFSNDCGNLSFHKQSLKGTIQDYVIAFHRRERDLNLIIEDTYALFLKLMEKFKDTVVKATLVAKMDFSHLGKEVEDRSYHFTSYSSEEVIDPREFFERHMMKISQRLDDFNANGSNLVLRSNSHIHIQLSCK